MTKLLKPDWVSKISAIKPKVYLLGNKAWGVIDNSFDKIHKLGRLKYITDPIFFNFPVFIFYKIDS